jgi:hypothetical protein
MASGTRIGKSVHSSEQAAFCGLMVGARKAAGLTQHALARLLKKPQSFVANMKVASAGSTLWNSCPWRGPAQAHGAFCGRRQR